MTPITLQEPFRAVFYAPFYAALARGDYAAEGVEVRCAPAPSRPMPRMRCWPASPTSPGAGRCASCWRMRRTRPARLRNFGAVVMGDPFFLVGRAPRPVSADRSGGADPRHGVARCRRPGGPCRTTSARPGSTPTMIRRVTDRGMAENLAAVAAGTLDVAQLFEPFVTHGRGCRHRRMSGTSPPAAGRPATPPSPPRTGAAAGEARRVQGDAAWPGADPGLGGGDPPEALAGCIAGVFPGHAAGDGWHAARALQGRRPLDRRPLLPGGGLHPAGDGDVHRRRHHPEAGLRRDRGQRHRRGGAGRALRRVASATSASIAASSRAGKWRGMRSPISTMRLRRSASARPPAIPADAPCAGWRGSRRALRLFGERDQPFQPQQTGPHVPPGPAARASAPAPGSAPRAR